MGWSGFCNTDRVMCGPVCGVGLGWGGVEWVLQHRPCYVRSCLWGWGGVGWGGVGFATQTVLCAVLSVGLGWGGVEWVLQHRPCYVLDPSGYFSLLPVHNDLINKDCGM